MMHFKMMDFRYVIFTWIGMTERARFHVLQFGTKSINLVGFKSLKSSFIAQRRNTAVFEIPRLRVQKNCIRFFFDRRDQILLQRVFQRPLSQGVTCIQWSERRKRLHDEMFMQHFLLGQFHSFLRRERESFVSQKRRICRELISLFSLSQIFESVTGIFDEHLLTSMQEWWW